MTEDEHIHKDAAVAAIGARLDNLETWMRTRPEKNLAPVYIGIISAVGTLIALGTFALRPVTENQQRLEMHVNASLERMEAHVNGSLQRMSDAIKEIEDHDSDGHPMVVVDRLIRIENDLRRHMDRNIATTERDEDRMDILEADLAVLKNVAKERTQLFTRNLEHREKMREGLEERVAVLESHEHEHMDKHTGIK